jgi:AraC-like DNA-binding protein
MDSNILVIGNQTTVFIGSLPDIGEHAHAAAVIALSLNGEEIGVRYLPNGDWQDQQAYFTHAALDSGFTDSALFSNSFRKLLGLAPTDFLASAKSLMLFASSDYV